MCRQFSGVENTAIQEMGVRLDSHNLGDIAGSSAWVARIKERMVVFYSPETCWTSSNSSCCDKTMIRLVWI